MTAGADAGLRRAACESRWRASARARCCSRRVPVVSVCPTTATSGNGRFLDRVQHSREQRPALVGQLVRLETKVEREVLRRRRKRGQRVAEEPVHVASLSTVTGAGAWVRDTVVDSRAPARSTAAGGVRDHRAADGAVTGSGSRTTCAWPGRSGGTRFGPQPAISSGGQHRAQCREGTRRVHSGTTRSASVVPRTPTTAAGVSRRMESGESLAMRPET